MKITNVWVQTNQGVIDTIKRTCIEHDMKGGYGGAVPLQHIIRLFDSAIIEINRLQRENDELSSKVKTHEAILEGQQGPRVSNSIRKDIIKEEK